MLRRQVLLFAVVVFGAAFALGDAISPTSISGSSDAQGVHLKWVSVDETGVARYEIWRSPGNAQHYDYLGKKMPAGSGTMYEFDDDTAFKTTDNFYSYEIRVVFSNGSTVSYFISVTTRNVSSVRRTWGSIKAMFR